MAGVVSGSMRMWTRNRISSFIDLTGSGSILTHWLELRARALELENESLLACLDSMVDKLCFCTWAAVTFQVVGSDLSDQRKTDVIPFRLIKLSPSLSTLMSLWNICHTLKLMPNQVFLSRELQNVQQMFLLWFQLH